MSDNSLDELREIFAVVTSALVKGELSESVTESLAIIPIRDAVLRYAFDNPELRETIVKSLDSITEVNSAVIPTLKAGIILLDGNREATRENVDKALELDGTYSLARLLDVALVHGVPASVWAQSLEAVSPDECLTGAE